jgi:hypothetical protein
LDGYDFQGHLGYYGYLFREFTLKTGGVLLGSSLY